jgi:DNA-binding MarR family transcriptional regulator
MGLAEEAFERLRRVAYEGGHIARTVDLRIEMKMSPGAIRSLMLLADHGGISMGEMARRLGCDPSYITALVDDLGDRGLAQREPAPEDRRVKMVVLTDSGREMAGEVLRILAVPPQGFSALKDVELVQLRDLLDKVLAATDPEAAVKVWAVTT